MNRSSSTEPTRTRSSHRLIIVSTATFGEASIALFKQAAPRAEFCQYPEAAAEDILPEVLAQAALREGRITGATPFVENMRRYVGGQPLADQVDFARGY